MKTIKPLVLLVAFFSATVIGAYAQGNGQQRQKQFRKGQGNCEKCEMGECDGDQCQKGQGKGRGRGKGQGQGQGQGQGRGKGRC